MLPTATLPCCRLLHTDKKPKKGEKDGTHYHFRDTATMQKLIDENFFVSVRENAVLSRRYGLTSVVSSQQQHTTKNGNLFGTSFKFVEEMLNKQTESTNSKDNSIFMFELSVEVRCNSKTQNFRQQHTRAVCLCRSANRFDHLATRTSDLYLSNPTHWMNLSSACKIKESLRLVSSHPVIMCKCKGPIQIGVHICVCVCVCVRVCA